MTSHAKYESNFQSKVCHKNRMDCCFPSPTDRVLFSQPDDLQLLCAKSCDVMPKSSFCMMQWLGQGQFEGWILGPFGDFRTHAYEAK